MISETLKSELLKAGYVRSPNNIEGLPGWIMYAGGPGVPTVGAIDTVQVTDQIRVYNMFSLATIAIFDKVSDFLAWCPRVSQGGVNFTYHN